MSAMLEGESKSMVQIPSMPSASSSAQQQDKVDLEFDVNRFRQFTPLATARERIRWIFFPNAYGFRSVECKILCYSLAGSLVVGFPYGGYRGYFAAMRRFMYNSRLKVFVNKRDAISRMKDSMRWYWAKNGAKIAARLFAVTGVAMTTFCVLSAYRGRFAFYDFAWIGGTLGIYSWRMGIQAILVSGLIGMVLSCIIMLLAAPLIFYYDLATPQLYNEMQKQHWDEQIRKINRKKYVWRVHQEDEAGFFEKTVRPFRGLESYEATIAEKDSEQRRQREFFEAVARAEAEAAAEKENSSFRRGDRENVGSSGKAKTHWWDWRA